MEWRVIPGYPAYEINRAGIVRNAVTKYHLGKNGRRYRLSAGGTRSNMHPYELVGMAFPGDDVETVAPVETVIAGSTTGQGVFAVADPRTAVARMLAHATGQDARISKDACKSGRDFNDKLPEPSATVESPEPVETLAPVVALAAENADLKRENTHLRRLVVELEAELQVYRVAI